MRLAADGKYVKDVKPDLKKINLLFAFAMRAIVVSLQLSLDQLHFVQLIKRISLLLL
jgi:hypothetical protein